MNLNFLEMPKPEKQKTSLWMIYNAEAVALGCIKWHAPWRRYCFFPIPNSLYDASCLKEITTFIDNEMTGRRAARAK